MIHCWLICHIFVCINKTFIRINNVEKEIEASREPILPDPVINNVQLKHFL